MSGGSEWGTIITVSRAWILGQPGNPLAYWWVYLPATAMFVLFSTAWNRLGDSTNAALDLHTA